LLPIQLAGFALAALSTFMAVRIRGPQARQWIEKVERISGRDFAYLLIGFALFNRLEWFCWGTTFGIYVFALVLIWLTVRRRRVESVE
jgi:hypothetical protein